jgi:phospholipase/carboxylesterase
MLRLGAVSPSRLVVLFHGLGGNAGTLKPIALAWAAHLPCTGFVCLGADGGDWFPYPPVQPEGEEARVQMIIETVQAAMTRADAVLDEQLRQAGLSDGELILAGFSQGAAMSAYTGLRRKCLGVIPMGGPCPPREQLLPDHQETRVCVITGDRDRHAPHEKIKTLFGKYPCEHDTDGVHVIPGLAHVVTDEHEVRGLNFLRSCGCE